MTRYVVLLAPSGNRVYGTNAQALCRAELEVMASTAAVAMTKVESVRIAAVDYVSFAADDLAQSALALVANLSSRHALFEQVGDLLRPIELNPIDRFDDDLVSIPKYSGKTNEHFTKLVLNVALASTIWAGEIGTRRFSVLDPLCGRGTTLELALTYGFDVAGVEIEEREVDALAAYLSTYLQRKRLKHTFTYEPVRRDGKRVGKRLDVEVNSDAAAFKRGEHQSLVVHCADTLGSVDLFAKRRFDVIIADAPYGVVHGSRARGVGRDGRQRNAAELLTSAVPVWARLLRPGGAMAIAWNTLGFGRDELAGVLGRSDLDVLDAEAYRSFAHRVDSSIVRDVIVGRKAFTRA